MRLDSGSGRRVNFRQIARELDISIMTLYRVVNNVPSVKEATRRRVVEALNWHGYYVHGQREEMTLVCDITSDTPYFIWLGTLLMENIARNVPHIRCFRSDHRKRPEEYFDLAAQSDMVAFCSRPENRIIERTREVNPRIYAITLGTNSSSDVVITTDNIRGGELTARHLHNAGHSHVLVFLDETHSERYERYKSFFSEFHLLNPGCRIDSVERKNKASLPQVCRDYFRKTSPWPTAVSFLVGSHAQRFHRDVVLPEPEKYGNLSIVSYDRPQNMFYDHPEEIVEFDRIEFRPEDMLDLALYYIVNRPLIQKVSHTHISVSACLVTAGSVKHLR